MGLVSLLFSLQGRINRGQYWFGALLVTVLGLVVMGLLFALSGASFEPGQSKEKMAGAVLTLIGVIFMVAVPMAYCQLAIQVKRFHDRGRTGWLSLVPMVLSAMIASSVVTAAISGAPAAQVMGSAGTLSFLSWLVQIAMLIDLGMLPSVAGPNKYGNPPGSPPSPDAPSAPKRSTQSAAAAASMFGGAEQAIDRAAEQHRLMTGQARPHPAPRPAGGGGFGRRVSPS